MEQQMHVAFKCSSCSRLYRVGEKFFGKGARCVCGASFIIPQGEDSDVSAESGADAVFSSLNEPITMDEITEGETPSSVASSPEPDMIANADIPDISSDLAVGDSLDGMEDISGESADEEEQDVVAANPAIDTDAQEDESVEDTPDNAVAFAAAPEKSYMIPRIITALAAAAVVAALFLPIWFAASPSSSTPQTNVALTKGLEFFADTGQTMPLAYAGIGGAALAAIMGLAALLRIRIGMIAGLILTIAAVVGGVLGMIPGLEVVSGLQDEPVQVYTEYLIPKLSSSATQIPGLICYLGGLVVLLFSGLACSFTALRRQRISAAVSVSSLPKSSVKKPVVVTPNSAAVISNSDDGITLDDAEDIGDIAEEFSVDEQALDADISESENLDSDNAIDDEDSEELSEDNDFQDDNKDFCSVEDSSDDFSSDATPPAGSTPVKKKFSKKKKAKKKMIKKIGMKKKP